MRIHPALAPVKACVCPLVKKLSGDARKVFDDLIDDFHVEFDEAGTIGKRYRRNDAIGTPFCITYDFDSLEDGCVTTMGFSRQEYWSRLPFPSPGDLPNPGIKRRSHTLQGNSLLSEP